MYTLCRIAAIVIKNDISDAARKFSTSDKVVSIRPYQINFLFHGSNRISLYTPQIKL